MAQIHYLTGDATEPVDTGGNARLIAHIVNDYGGWGRGFVLALSHKDDTPERAYRKMAGQDALVLGEVHYSHFGPAKDDIRVANMVAQRGYVNPGNLVAVDYDALRTCLDEVGDEASYNRATVHMPRIGCGLGGGDWSEVEEIIQQELVDRYDVDVYVYVYDLPETS